MIMHKQERPSEIGALIASKHCHDWNSPTLFGKGFPALKVLLFGSIRVSGTLSTEWGSLPRI